MTNSDFLIILQKKEKILISRCEQIIARIRKIPVWIWLAGILLLSFLLKLLCWHWDPTVSRDGSLYIHLSQIWYETGSFQGVNDSLTGIWLPPLFLYLIKSLMYMGLSAELAGVWLNLTLGTFTPLLVYGIAYETTQKKNVSVCAALLIAVNPSMNALSVEVQRDMIYLFFAGLTLWLLTAGVRRQKWYFWFFSGFPASCAILTRFETLEFLVIVPLSLFLLFLGKFCSWKKVLCYTGIFFISVSGLVLALSCLMQTQDYLIDNYVSYFQNKFVVVKHQVTHDFTEPEK